MACGWFDQGCQLAGGTLLLVGQRGGDVIEAGGVGAEHDAQCVIAAYQTCDLLFRQGTDTGAGKRSPSLADG